MAYSNCTLPDARAERVALPGSSESSSFAEAGLTDLAIIAKLLTSN